MKLFLRRLASVTLALLVIAIAAAYLFLWRLPLRNPHPVEHPASGLLAISDVRLYPSPEANPIDHATVVMKDGIIQSVQREAEPPAGARVLTCKGCVVTAGFWNTHVHFTQPVWDAAAWKSAPVLNAALERMLTHWGFTTVIDAGSDLRNTISLRRRIAAGDLRGPWIYTAGSGLYPPNGIPFYIRESMPAWMLRFLLQPDTAEEAAADVERNINRGADLLKLFTGSYVTRDRILPMPENIAKAAVQVAHRHGQLAYAHPSDLAGTLAALHGGVDILAHAPDTTDGIDDSVLRQLVNARMSMIPTLHMFAATVTTKPAYLNPIYEEVRKFHELGGELLFGTDVGYMRDYNTTGEYRALRRCGLSFQDVLRMLTTAPAARSKANRAKGTVEEGKAADLVVLEADPAQDITAFARVRYTIRNGSVLYNSRFPVTH